jgi:hypothetical protein
MNNQYSESDDLLDQVIKQIRQQDVPSYPCSEILSETRCAGTTRPTPPLTKRRNRLKPRPMTVAAAVLAIVIGSGIILVNSALRHAGAAAFAEMQEAVGRAGSVRFYLLRFARAGDPSVTAFMRLGPDRWRQELPGGDFIVEDLKAQERMHVSHRDHTAVIEPLYVSNDYSRAQADSLRKLRDLPGRAAKRIGERTLDGRKVIDFDVNLDGDASKVSVDAATKLPVQIEIVHPSHPGHEAIREVVKDFVFDASLDESLFRVVPPAGYTIVRHSREEPSSGDASVLVVSPETGIGPIKFGMSADDVIRALGEPNWRKDHRYADNLQPRPELDAKDAGKAKYVMTELAYDARGFRLAVGAPGGLHSIHCFNQTSMGPSVRDFQGKTREGIKLGARPNDVVKAYGEPDAKMGTDNYWYAKQGWQFSFRDGKLVSYQLNPPNPALKVEVHPDGTSEMRIVK